MIVVAVLVCGFAVGMAGLLNYFKYRSTVQRIVTERIVSTGRMVENSIQASLLLGLQFGDIGTLTATLERERATDDVLTEMEVFDVEGTVLYSTDQTRVSKPVPAAWVIAARKASSTANWLVEGPVESTAGISIENNFGLTIGYLAMRYSNERVQQGVRSVARELAVATLTVFIASAIFASFALITVMRRLKQDVATVESALRAVDPVRASAATTRGLFGAALQRFVETVRSAETEIAALRARMQRGAGQ